MEYIVNENKEIELKISTSNHGKFRFKNRKNKKSFGEIFATREVPFTEKAYLEWQIGYDVPAKGDKASEAKFQDQTFVGSNGEKKYIAELSEIFYVAAKEQIISKNEIKNLLEEIKKYEEFICDRTISMTEEPKIISLNNTIKFEETSINLPTFLMGNTPDGAQIEVSVKQQQYASGVQPMIYFCIPITSFKNAEIVLNKTSNKKDKLVYVINNKNIQNMVDLIKTFGMTSKKHKNDIIKILDIIILKLGD